MDSSQRAASVPFAAHRSDSETVKTLLSELAGEHSIGGGILGFF
jgi:hypothetical protein